MSSNSTDNSFCPEIICVSENIGASVIMPDDVTGGNSQVVVWPDRPLCPELFTEQAILAAIQGIASDINSILLLLLANQTRFVRACSTDNTGTKEAAE